MRLEEEIDDGVFLNAGRRDPELDAGEMVVMGVEDDRELVGVRDQVSARQPPDDTFRRGIQQPRGHVDRFVVVGDLQLRLLARRLPLVWQPLDETADDGRGAPRRVVQAPVDADRGHRANRANPHWFLGSDREFQTWRGDDRHTQDRALPEAQGGLRPSKATKARRHEEILDHRGSTERMPIHECSPSELP